MIKENEFFIWDERNSIELTKNLESKKEIEILSITKNIQKKLNLKECDDTGKTKRCSKCNKEKYLVYFYKQNRSKDGYRPCCKDCVFIYAQNYKLKRRDSLKLRYHVDETYRNKCLINYHKYRNSPKNYLAIKETQRKNKIKYRNDPKFNIINTLRCRIRSAVRSKGKKKFDKTMSLIGCDRQTLILHLESKFKEGMTWDGYGFKGWHIDHIKPCCKFDLSNEDEQRKCFHYTNLQPSWWYENLRKGGRFIG